MSQHPLIPFTLPICEQIGLLPSPSPKPSFPTFDPRNWNSMSSFLVAPPTSSYSVLPLSYAVSAPFSQDMRPSASIPRPFASIPRPSTSIPRPSIQDKELSTSIPRPSIQELSCSTLTPFTQEKRLRLSNLSSYTFEKNDLIELDLTLEDVPKKPVNKPRTPKNIYKVPGFSGRVGLEVAFFYCLRHGIGVKIASNNRHTKELTIRLVNVDRLIDQIDEMVSPKKCKIRLSLSGLLNRWFSAPKTIYCLQNEKVYTINSPARYTRAINIITI